jgi:hypothetical protein
LGLASFWVVLAFVGVAGLFLGTAFGFVVFFGLEAGFLAGFFWGMQITLLWVRIAY